MAKNYPKGWRLSLTTRAFIIERRFAEDAVVDVMKWGYYVIDFSPYHVRVQDEVDFWPTSLKWRAPRGYKFCNHGFGLQSLKAYLDEYLPLEEAA